MTEHASRESRLETYVALLRGINVGGKRPVAMAELRACFQELGYRDVKTYINSGNVIFRTASERTRTLEFAIEAALLAHFSEPLRALVRSLPQMRAVVESIPPGWHDAADEARQNVIFLGESIDRPTLLDELPARREFEDLHHHPGVLLWAVERRQLTRSAMLKVGRLPIYQEMTIRGVQTTRKVYELMLQADRS